MSRLKGKKQEIAAVLLGISVAVILWMAIFSRETMVEDSFLYRPFHSLSSFWSSIRNYGLKGNFLGNILAFVPVGLLYPIAFSSETERKRSVTILFGLCLSLLIELAQLLFSKGYFDLDDIVLNTLGTVSGYMIYKVSAYRLKKHLSYISNETSEVNRYGKRQ